MVPFIILLACMVAGVALHLYQVLSLLLWIGRRTHCGDRCERVTPVPRPALAVVSLSAEPPDSMKAMCRERLRLLQAAGVNDAAAHRRFTT
ncbi:hypothetical protein [Rhodopila globiformis]|nr:hypothetical protein [Rhodopila globiformis]